MYTFKCPICMQEITGDERNKVLRGARDHALKHEPGENARDLAEQNTTPAE